MLERWPPRVCLYLLVGLHFTAHHSVGVGRGVVIDVDAAEGRAV